MKHVPNIITLLNLLAGTLALIILLMPPPSLTLHPYIIATLLIAAGALCDLLDGLSARLLHVQSELGKQLDSLADLITFSLAPTAIYAHMLYHYSSSPLPYPIAILIPASITLASAIRLAQFNISTKQHHHFIGLPTPASAILTLGIALQIALHPLHPITNFITLPQVLIPIILIQALLLNAPIHLISLKFKKPLTLKAITPHLLILACALPLVILAPALSPTLIIIAYIIICLPLQKQLKQTP